MHRAEEADVDSVSLLARAQAERACPLGSGPGRIGSRLGDQAAWNRASGRTGERGGARVGKPR
jgi:hypothetical protein